MRWVERLMPARLALTREKRSLKSLITRKFNFGGVCDDGSVPNSHLRPKGDPEGRTSNPYLQEA